MRYIVFTLIVFYSSMGSVASAQNCEKDFIESIKKTYKKQERKFLQIAQRYAKKEDAWKDVESGDATVLTIPFIEGRLKCKDKKMAINKENLLCYLKSEKLTLDEAVIIKDSTILGSVGFMPTTDGDYLFRKTNEYIELLINPLVKKIMEIKPDVVIGIYNSQNSYLYIKEDKLYALVCEQQGPGKLEQFKVLEMNEFIQRITFEHFKSIVYGRYVKTICM